MNRRAYELLAQRPQVAGVVQRTTSRGNQLLDGFIERGHHRRAGSSEKPGSAIAAMADLSADHDPRLALPVSYRSKGRSGGAANTPEPGQSDVCR
jgi:hypothetical protein